jgi:organic hydroperoxide reductase OsmC/OhrA
MAITDAARVQEALKMHHRAHELCFLARSMNFPVEHEPEVVVAGEGVSSSRRGGGAE